MLDIITMWKDRNMKQFQWNYVTFGEHNLRQLITRSITVDKVHHRWHRYIDSMSFIICKLNLQKVGEEDAAVFCIYWSSNRFPPSSKLNLHFAIRRLLIFIYSAQFWSVVSPRRVNVFFTKKCRQESSLNRHSRPFSNRFASVFQPFT